MAQYQNLRGLYKNLPAQSVDGAIYWTLDGTILMGIEGGAYKEYGSVTTVANKEALPESASPAMLFYIESDNVLAKYDEVTSAYVQINKDSDTTYEFAKGDNEGELKIVAKDKSGKQVGEPVVVSVVDVAGLNSAIAEAKAAGDKGIEDAAAVAERVEVIESDYLKKVDKEELAAVDAGQETRITTLEAVVGSLTGDEEGGLGSITESIQSAINELDVTDAEVEGQFVSKVDEVDGKVVVTRKALVASDIPEIGQDKVTGLVDSIADAKKAGTDAQEYAEGVNTAFGEYKTTNDEAVQAAKKAGDDAQSTIDEYKTSNDARIKTIEDDYLKQADRTALEEADEALSERITANAEAIATEKARMDAFMKLEDGQTLNDALDSLKELQDYITNEAADADIVVGKVSAIEAILAGIGGEGEEATVVAYVTKAIEALKIGDYAKAVDLSAAVERIAANEQTLAGLGALAQKDIVTEADIDEALAEKINASAEGNHAHSNKEVLDGITAELIVDWNDAVAKEHEHANKALLDTYTQTEADLADAVAKKHEHANAEELAKIASGDKAKWDEAATKAVANETAIGGVSDRVSALEEIDHDAYVAADEQVVSDMQAYADQAEADAVATANAYCDEKLSEGFQWGEF